MADLIKWCDFVNGEPGVIDEDISQYNPRLGEWEPRPAFLNKMQANLSSISVLEEDRLERCDYESISHS